MSSIPSTSFLRAAILASTPALAVLIVSLKKTVLLLIHHEISD
jgi:hypothetical protein